MPASRSTSQLTTAMLTNIAESVPALIVVYNINSGEYVYVNKAVKKLLGYAPNEFISKGLVFVGSLVHPDDVAAIMQQNAAALKKANRTGNHRTDKEAIVSFEYRMRHKKGHYIWLQTDGSVFSRDHKGKVEYVLNASINISERKHTAQKLQKLSQELEDIVDERSNRLELVLKASNMGIWEWNLKTNTLWWSGELKALYGLKPSDVIDYKRYIQLRHPVDRPVMKKVISDALKHGKSYSVEHRIIWPDGSVHWILGQGQAVVENGKPVRMVGASMSIDKRKEIEIQLRQSEERYQAFIHHSKEGIWRVELEKPISIKLSPLKQIDLMYKYAYLAEANDAMAHMYKLTSGDDLIGLRLGDLLVRSDPANTAYLKAFIKAGYKLAGVDSHEVDADGNDKYFRNSLVGIIEKGKLIRGWGTQLDVTEQRKADEALIESEDRFRTMADTAPVMIWVTGPDKQVTYYNQPWLDYTGGSLAVQLQKQWQFVHPDERDRCIKIFRDAFDTRASFKMEFRLRRHDGTYRWMLDTGTPRFGAKGKFLGYIGSCVDIHELQEKRELEKRAARLVRQQKELVALNRAKDEFISIASHQLRTPATGVKQYIGMLLEGYAGPMSSDQQRYLQQAYESNERQLIIVSDLLHVAKVDAGKVILNKQPHDLNELTQQIIAEHRDRILARKQKLQISTAAKQLIAAIDRDRIRMVIENMLDNAIKYSPDGRTITIRLWANNQFVNIRIKDQGVGIDQSDFYKLFQKFSRISNPLSDAVGGSGLGLYWAKQIVELHNGSINLNSSVNKGSAFTIKLPSGVSE